jgi:hypothetical protein
MKRFFIEEKVPSFVTNVYSVTAESQEQAIELVKTGNFKKLDTTQKVMGLAEFSVVQSPIKNEKFKYRKEYESKLGEL